MTEEWRAAPGFEGFYEVSNEGRARSVARTLQMRSRSGTPFTRWWESKVLKPGLDGRGYAFVQASVNGVAVPLRLHRAICAAWHGPAPEGRPHACHNDGNKMNNRPGNLRWDSISGNILDRERHGTGIRGSRNPMCNPASRAKAAASRARNRALRQAQGA